MNVTRGLIIADPWVGHILEGRKDWEMRSQATAHRGWFGLIRKGSGQVMGLARLVDCGRALSESEMIDSFEHHRIPDTMIRNGEVSKWVIPWKLADIRRLDRAIPYEHKSGAVTWVSFSAGVAAQLQLVLEGSASQSGVETLARAREVADDKLIPISSSPTDPAAPRRVKATLPTGPSSGAPERLLGRSRLSGGNLRNNHFYLTDFMNDFPADIIGGRNRHEAAAREVTVDWGGPNLVMTDIDHTKRMFRARGWVRQFFAASGAREGDFVVVTSPSPYQVRVRVEHASAF